jgi:iron complex outermembrane receptor protein
VLPADGGPLKIGSEFVADLEARYEATDNITVALGVENLFDNKPDLNIRARNAYPPQPAGAPVSNWFEPTQATVSGQRYVDSSLFGYNGGFWYVRLNAKF